MAGEWLPLFASRSMGGVTMNEQDNFRESRNIHDPHNQYVWAEEESLAWTLCKIVVGGTIAFLFMVMIATGGLLL